MRPAIAARIVGLLVIILAAVPVSLSSLPSATAWHVGAIECSAGGNPEADGVIAPGEYGENYFDGRTKLLLYVDCANSTERTLNVGIVSPWRGWVGLLVQATDAWNGTVNEVRVSYSETTGVETLDAHRNETSPTIPDLGSGGSSDIDNATAARKGPATVFEFSIPLRSGDRFDSQLSSAGPFSFGLEYHADSVDLGSSPTAISDLHSFLVATEATFGGWTVLELRTPTASAPLVPTTMLVTLRDAEGYPVPYVQVETFVRTAFDMLDAGPVATNAIGVAEVLYAPRGNGTYLVGAAYTGGGQLLASVAWESLTVGSPAGNDIQLGLLDDGTFTLRPVEALIVVAVASVWAAYAYAFFLTDRALREEREPTPSRHRSRRNGRVRQ